MIFYLGAAPLTAREAWRKRDFACLRDPLAGLFLVTILWFGLTLLWGVNQPAPRIGQYAAATVTNALFVIGGLLFFSDTGNPWRERLFRFLPIAATVNIVISALHYYVFLAQSFDTRLTGWAETRHQILGSDIIAVTAVFALRNLFEPQGPGNPRRERVLQGLSLFAALIFIVLTGSRGSFVALAWAAGLFLWLVRPRLMFLVFLCLTVLAGGLFFASEPLRHFIMENVLRDPMRLRIWAATLDYVAERPLLGYGVATVATFTEDWITFPHSMYFSALFYGGCVGLALVAMLFSAVVWRILKRAENRDRAFLLALISIPLIAGITDTGQFIKNPSPQWYIVWLPIIIATAMTVKGKAAADIPRAESASLRHSL
ncbi:O-antigen ligase family protein [Telmatospirillum siberiense]|nr:O-antigen ligase family protein [Telmatospirillum siberiense]